MALVAHHSLTGWTPTLQRIGASSHQLSPAAVAQGQEPRGGREMIAESSCFLGRDGDIESEPTVSAVSQQGMDFKLKTLIATVY